MTKYKLRFIRWFHKKYPGKYCWADCVAWAYSSRCNPFKIDSSKGCEKESLTHSTKACYCGGWVMGKCWDKLTKDERKEIIATKDEIFEGIPF